RLRQAAVTLQDRGGAGIFGREEVYRGSRKRLFDAALLQIRANRFIAVPALRKLARTALCEAVVVDRSQPLQLAERPRAHFLRDTTSAQASRDLACRGVPPFERAQRHVDGNTILERPSEVARPLAPELLADTEPRPHDRVRGHDAPRLAVELER